jgi:TonB family protein
MVAGLLCALLVGQTPAPPAEAAPAGVLTRAPVLKRFVEAEYPPRLAAAGVAGAVGLSLVIDASGAVERATVTAPSGQPALDSAALHAVVQFEFEPAEIDGRPAAVEIDYRYEFVQRRAPTPPTPAEAPPSLRGRVVERGTRAPVVGATVDAGAAVAVTDADGRFELRGLATGPVALRIASGEHQPFAVEETIVEGQVREVEYFVRRRHYDPYEAVVRGERDRKEVSVRTLSQDEVRTLPGTQGDTLKVLQNLPGVARSPFGIGLLVVRGSAPQDTKVYVDGIEIPLLFHFGGITSVVASDTVGTLEFYPGNFGARFGRAMGGTVDVRTREPGRDFHGSAQIDVFDGSARAEGALGEGTWSVAVRRSWVDGVLAIVLPQVAPRTAAELRVAPRYYDYQAKLGYPLLGGQAELLAFGSDDALEFVRPEDSLGRPTFSLRTAFHRLALRYRHPLGADASHEATVAAGWDRFDVLQGDNFGVLSTIRSIALRDTLRVRATEALSLELGVDALLRGFDYAIYAPPLRAPGQVGGFVGDTATQVGEAARGSWLSPAVYAEADWRPFPRWRVVPGLRLDFDSRVGQGSPWLDPRLAVSYEVTPRTVLTAAAGAYGEPPAPQQTTRSFGNPDLGVQRAWEYSLGVRRELPWSSGLEVTAFFKELREVVGATRAAAPDGTPLLLSNGTVGQVWGVEALLRRQLARGLYGWIAYTLSESSRRDDPSMPSYPAWHLFGFDQTHVLTVVMSYRTGADWTLGTRLRGASGNPYTPAVGSVLLSDAGRYQCLGAARPFSARLPGFFQADVRVDKRFVYDLWSLSVYLDVQNATNRANAEFNFRSFDCSQRVAVAGLPVFPTLGARAEW